MRCTCSQLRSDWVRHARPCQDEAPWVIGNYYPKKLARETDSLGNIVQSDETIAKPLAWNSKTELDLALQVVSRDTGMPVEELSQRVSSLMVVLPGVDSKLAAMKPADMVRLACRVDDVANKLVLLKQSFPTANVSQVVTECRHMLLLDLEHFQEAVLQVQTLLSSAADPSALLNAAPMLLDPQVLTSVLDEMQRLFGATAQPLVLLQWTPGLAYSCQSLESQARGDRDAAYLGGIFSVGQQGVQDSNAEVHVPANQ